MGDPNERFREDSLRMMRAVRIAAQKDFKIEEKTKDAINTNSELIEKVSRERINGEITKTLMSERPGNGLRDFHETHLLKQIAPDLDVMYDTPQHTEYHKVGGEYLNVGRHTERVLDNIPPVLELRWAALLHDAGKPRVRTYDAKKQVDRFFGHPDESAKITEQIMSNLKNERKLINKVKKLVELHEQRLEPERERICKFIFTHQDVTPEVFEQIITLQRADVLAQNPEIGGGIEARLEKLDQTKAIFDEITAGPYRVKDLALTGNEIMELKREKYGEIFSLSGREVGEANQLALKEVLRNPKMNTKENLKTFLEKNLLQIKNLAAAKQK